MDAVVPAAGEGTRLRPLTDGTPKPLVEVAGRPLLAHVFDALAPTNPRRYVVVIGYRGSRIVDRFGDSYRDVPIEYVRQDEPRGLAHAVLQAEPAVGGDLLVCNGDNVFGTDLCPLAREHTRVDSRDTEPAATMLVEEVTSDVAKTTGVVLTDDSGTVRRVVEKPEEPPGTTVSAGAFAFSPAVFDACRAIEPSARGEYEIADAVTHLVERGREVRTVELDGDRVNVNTPADVEAAERLVAGRDARN